ncbi:hypothetical Protein YC6258_02862 [Gynuella sunshinyii YC6258]|uniref:Uncharacterized protein n=1 Tax=Gynuella sunshinyii YC6258 TaxID=1445510 RepID=A0A0C5V617_9GAMM|nr:hypothetical Protein YC6258_02862 [Gynuella sunshinyii YC6258]
MFYQILKDFLKADFCRHKTTFTVSFHGNYLEPKHAKKMTVSRFDLISMRTCLE